MEPDLSTTPPDPNTGSSRVATTVSPRPQPDVSVRRPNVAGRATANRVGPQRRRSGLIVGALVGGAALIVGGGAVAVWQLSKPGQNGTAIDAPNGANPVNGPGASAAPGGNPTPVDQLESAPQARPGQYADLNYTWTAYPADSAEALALKFDPDAKYAVGTTDGPDGVTTSLFANTDNGWQPIAAVEGDQFTIVGDMAYSVVFDEGAIETGHPEKLRAYDIAADSWSDVALPDGTTAALPPDADSLMASTHISIGTTNDVLLASIGNYYELDPLTMNIGETSYPSVIERPDGSPQLVITDFECVDRISMESPSGTWADPKAGSSFSECERPVDPAQYGITDEELSLASKAVNTYWMMSAGTWQQLDFPDDGSVDGFMRADGTVEAYVSPDAGDSADEGSRLYRFDGTSSFQPLYDGVTFSELAQIFGGSGQTQATHALATSGSYVLNQDLASNEWTATDLNTLGDGPGWGLYTAYPDRVIEAANGGVIAIGSVSTGVPAEPTELTSGDYTLRFDAGTGQQSVINNANGQQFNDWYLSTVSGQIELITFDESTGNEKILASFNTHWTDVPALNIENTSAVFVSPDGVQFGTVDANQLTETINGAPAGDLVLNSVHESAGQIVVTGSFIDIYDDQGGTGYVFVGTPA